MFLNGEISGKPGSLPEPNENGLQYVKNEHYTRYAQDKQRGRYGCSPVFELPSAKLTVDEVWINNVFSHYVIRDERGVVIADANNPNTCKIRLDMFKIDAYRKELENRYRLNNDRRMRKRERPKTCNFCDFASWCGVPDGVLCGEEQHQEGKDRWQYEGHTCEYFKNEFNNNVYGQEDQYETV